MWFSTNKELKFLYNELDMVGCYLKDIVYRTLLESTTSRFALIRGGTFLMLKVENFEMETASNLR